MSKYDDIISATPYDDVFHTLLNDCSPLALPLINEMFGETYTGKEKIFFSPNEHYRKPRKTPPKRFRPSHTGRMDSLWSLGGDISGPLSKAA